jgi:hypothetical protein
VTPGRQFKKLASNKIDGRSLDVANAGTKPAAALRSKKPEHGRAAAILDFPPHLFFAARSAALGGQQQRFTFRWRKWWPAIHYC